jgi:hypothetical protein
MTIFMTNPQVITIFMAGMFAIPGENGSPGFPH